MAKHDENKDVKLVSRRCKVSLYDKSIEATKGTIIGNRLWGRIDFLVNHCGWRFYWTTGPAKAIISFNDDSTSNKDVKKASKQNNLTDKTKRKKK